MKKISQHASARISFYLCIVMLTGLVCLVFVMPFVFKPLLLLFNKPLDHYTLILALLYFALIPALAACASLLFLLRRIMNEEIFTLKSVSLLRLISWCCFAEIPIFGALGCFFITSLLLAGGCGFLGMILRVVKNVIGNATEIKEENDLTV